MLNPLETLKSHKMMVAVLRLFLHTKVVYMPAPLKNHVIRRLDRIFIDKKWNYDGEDREKYADMYNNFCKLLELLPEDDQSLILDLTVNFEYHPLCKYETLLNRALSKLPADYFKSFNNIYIISLNKPSESSPAKSGSTLLYPSKNIIRRKYSVKAESYDSVDILIKTKHSRKKSLVIFVDDFIGTGETAIKALDNYLLNYSANDDEVIVVSLISLKVGVTVINDYGVEVFNALTMERGISDSPAIKDKPGALDKIDKIEDRLKVTPDYRRGYKQSEALVSLDRTPNNTFPLFWTNAKVDGKKWPAPFYR